MDYQRVYNEFIADRREKEKSLSGYTEKHHIIPRSLGGDDSKKNLIKLTASDHYFAHCVLAKIHGGAMWNSLYLMSQASPSTIGRPPRQLYSYQRKNMAREAGKRSAARWQDEEFRARMEENEHHKSFGSRMAGNEKRIAKYRAYVENTDIGAIVSKRYKDPEYYQQWKDSQKDVWTPERRQYVGERTKELWATPEYRNNIRREKTPGTWTSAKLKELWQNPEYRKKMANRPLNSGCFQKGREATNKKQVLCVDTGRIFNSCADAFKWLAETKGIKGLHGVARTCRGEQKTCGGYRWAYVDS